MILYDISMPISTGMPVYKNREEKRPVFKISSDFEQSSMRQGSLEMDLHTGTHVDMPLHFIPGGASSDSWDEKDFFTRCAVLDLTVITGEAITAKLLGQLEKEWIKIGLPFKQYESILFKTRNSFTESFDYRFTYLEESGARFLTEKNLCAIGIDALGIERDQSGHETHKTLLGAGILIIEGLRLGAVPAGEYTLLLAPLKLKNVEAMPARALLLEAGMTKRPG